MRNTRTFRLAVSSFVTTAVASTLLASSIASAQGGPPMPPQPPRAGGRAAQPPRPPGDAGMVPGRRGAGARGQGAGLMDAREARQAVDGQAANGPLSPAALLRMREQLALTPDQLRRLETMQAELGGILTPPQRAQIEQRLRTRRVTERRAGQQFPPDRQGAADRRGIGRGAPSPMERAAMRRAIERRMSAGARPGARPGMVMQREMETGPGMRPAGVGRGMGPGMRPGMGPRMGHGMGRNIGPAPRRDPRQRDDRDRDRGRDRNRRG